jgi:NAD(P)-dependent dehydrogenase (short-subunit alcohol dehydrogenase family)
MSGYYLLGGQVAVVTGAARGIGSAIARRFAEEGARVVLGDVDLAGAEAVATEIVERGGDAVACHLDVTDQAAIERALALCLTCFGQVDVLVANAGILYNAPFLETPREAWDRLIAVNLTGVFLCMQVFGRHLVQAGRGGRILVTASTAGKRGSRFHGAYCATKFGVIGLLQSLAAELAPHGILVNGVCPGNVETPMGEQLVASYAHLLEVDEATARRDLLAESKIPRPARPEEVADAFVYLASPLASYVTGATLHVDGGMVMR